MEVRLTVGPGGWLDWLPQETILFDRAALDRRTVIDLAAARAALRLRRWCLAAPPWARRSVTCAFATGARSGAAGVPLSGSTRWR
jgi:urease accessory protein